MTFNRMLLTAALFSTLAAAPALAHPGHAHEAGFATGFAHPFGGLDHLLAMLAVGLWAIQQSGQQAMTGDRRALWLLPAAFVLPMAGGFSLGAAGFALPGVETGIALSVLVLGLVVALAMRPPLPAAMAATAAFALFHGHAHGTEMPQAEMALVYGAGMVLATALLHAIGIVAARLAQQLALPALTRAAGGAVALAGLVILAG